MKRAFHDLYRLYSSSRDVKDEPKCEWTLRDAYNEVGVYLISCNPGHICKSTQLRFLASLRNK